MTAIDEFIQVAKHLNEMMVPALLGGASSGTLVAIASVVGSIQGCHHFSSIGLAISEPFLRCLSLGIASVVKGQDGCDLGKALSAT